MDGRKFFALSCRNTTCRLPALAFDPQRTALPDIRPDLLGNNDNNYSADNGVYFDNYTVNVS
jgi:hypothetical protein